MKRFFKLLFIVLVILVGIIVFVFATRPGLQLLVGQIQSQAPAGVSVESATGRLLGPLTIQGLSYTSPQAEVTVAEINLDWRWSDLLNKRLRIDKLLVDGVEVTLKPVNPIEDDQPPTEPFNLPERLVLPVEIDVQNVTIQNILIQRLNEAEPILINSVNLSAQALNDNTTSTSITIDSPLLNLTAALSAQTRGDYPVSGTVQWRVNPPGVESVKGNTTLSGTINALEISNLIEAPYSLRTTSVVNNALSNPQIDVKNELRITDFSLINTDFPNYGVSGDLRITGPVAQAKLTSTLRLTGVLPQAIQSRLDATFNSKIITVDGLNVSVEDHPLVIHGIGAINLSGTEPTANLKVDWSDLGWPLDGTPVVTSKTGQVNITGSLSDLKVNADATLSDQGRIKADGTLLNESIDVKLGWTDLQWPADGSQLNNLEGTATLKGLLDQYQIALTSQVDTATVPDIKLQVSGFGSKQQMTLSQMNIATPDGQLTGQSNVQWAPDLAMNATVVGSNINPAMVAADFPGNLALSMEASAETVNGVLNTQLKALDINGTLRSLPLMINSSAQSVAGKITIDRFALKSGPTAINVTGSIADEIDLTWDIDSPDLSTLLPDASGVINGQGRIIGALPLPTVNADLQATGLAYGDYGVQSLKTVAAINPNPSGDINISFAVDKATGPVLEISEVRATTTGQMNNHNIRLSARSDQGNIESQISGALENKNWNFKIDTAEINVPDFDPWALTRPASGALSAVEKSIESLCFNSGTANLCASGSQSNSSTTATYQLSGLPVGYFKSILPDTSGITGTIASNGTVSLAANGSPAGSIDLQLTDGSLATIASDGEKVRLTSELSSQINATLNAEGLATKGVIDLGSQGRFDLSIDIAGQPEALMDGTLAGRIVGEIPDLSVVAALSPDIGSITGKISSDITLQGSVKRPKVSGGINSDGVSIELTQQGIVIQDIKAALVAKEGTELGINVSARSGQGSVNIDGTADLATAPNTISLKITGRDFQVMNTAEARANISPDLLVKVGPESIMISGLVDVPTVAITPKKISAGVVTVSPDQIIVTDSPAKAAQSPLPVEATVRVTLGKNVAIDALGLNARLTGDITVKEKPGAETTATGELNIVDGTFKAYGQNLQIIKGRILFADTPISQPGFDIEAVRNVTSELQVGVRARGAIDNPTISLFSTPSMSQSEQMSYLVFGRPLEGNSPAESSAVRQAAMALGVIGGKFLTEKFGDKLGLDQVAIDSELRETGEQASLVVGKYLSPRLFVSYGIGLFEPVSTLKLNYTISKYVKLISETTESRSGGDIIFTFEGGSND